MIGRNFSTFTNNVYFWKLVPSTLASVSEEYISNSQNLNEINKEVKSSKVASLLRKQRLEYPKNVVFGNLNINSLPSKFVSIPE